MNGLYDSLRIKLILYYLLLISIPLIAIILISNYFFNKSIDEQANEHTSQMIMQVQSNIGTYINLINKTISFLQEDPNVVEFMSISSTSDANRIECETQVRRVMRSFTALHEEMSGILIINKNDIYASNELYRIARYPLIDDFWYKQANEANGEMLLISKPIGRNIRNWKNHATSDIISVVRGVFDEESGECLGVILIDMYNGIIDKQIRDVTLGKTGYVFIMQNNGEIVYAPANKTVYRIRPEWLKGKNAINMKEIQGEKYQLIHANDPFTGWNTVGVFSYGEALEPIAAMQFINIIVILFTILFAGLVAIMFSSTITKPISVLRSLMLKAENGNLDVYFEEGKHTGEIAGLGQSFNAMMDKIRELIHLVYIEQQRKRDAELKALQMQIKPHFLYNSLDTIKWMAQEINAREIVNTVSALSQLFRIGISRGREIIPLKEELTHVKSYLYIQKIRYEDKLNYSIECDSSLESYMVQKLIMQPIVENAIYHGIKQIEENGNIEIKIHAEDVLYITVTDNGIGMSESKCIEFNELLQQSNRKNNMDGYGLFNVNDRIKLSYGNEYGVTFHHVPQGTVVVISHPILSQTMLGGNFDKIINS